VRLRRDWSSLTPPSTVAIVLVFAVALGLGIQGGGAVRVIGYALFFLILGVVVFHAVRLGVREGILEAPEQDRPARQDEEESERRS
jgi:hypothetical protein